MADSAEIIHFPARRDDAQSSGPDSPPGPARSPQVEDGYTRVSNELLTALASAGLSSREYRVAIAVIRLTYGWQVKAARIHGDDLARESIMHADTCSRVVAELLRRKVLFRAGGSHSPMGLNKHYRDWLVPKSAQRKAPTKSSVTDQKRQKETDVNGQKLSDVNGQAYKERKETKDNPSFANAQSGGACDNEQPEIELDPPNPKPSGKAKPYPDEFEQVWQEYPKRAGSNPKNHAFQAWQARRKEGVPAEQMREGLRRYVAFCSAKGSAHTEFVMQAKRFFGPSLEFDNDWVPPVTQPQHPRQDGRMGFAQPLPVGSYTPTNEDNLPDWARGL